MITMSDIRTRKYNLSKDPNTELFNSKAVLEQFNKKYSMENFKIILNNWNRLNKNTNIAFSMLMESFDKVCENGTVGEINSISSYIAENIVPTVRNGMQTANYVKMKTRRFKTKLSTKINRKVDKTRDRSIEDSDKIQARSNNAKVLNIKTGVQPKKDDKEQAKQEAYDKILTSANMQAHCDRILNNQNIISKYFDPVDVLLNDVDLESGIIEFCKNVDRFVNTIDCVKYNTMLENIWYTLESNNVKYDMKLIPDTVTNYFLFKDNLDKETVHSLCMVLEKTELYPEDCLIDSQEILLDGITTGDEESTDPDNIEFIFTGVEFEKEFETLMKESTEDKDKEKVKKMMDDFRKKANKTPFDLKNLIAKFYTLKPSNIIDETPNILNMVRLFFVMSPLAINPILGSVSLLADYGIKMHFRRKETGKLLDKYKKEKEKAKKKLDKLDEDSPSYKRMKSYADELEKDIKKINSYYESLHTDDENLDREINSNDSSDDGDFDFNFDDLKIESLTNELQNMIVLSEQIEKLNFECDYISGHIVKDSLSHGLEAMIGGETEYLNDVTNYTLTCPILSKKLVTKLMQDELYNSKKQDKIDYRKIDTLNNCIDRLNKEEQTAPKSLKEWTNCLEILNLLCGEKIYSENVMLELDLSNNLKLIADKMKRGATKLSDKEKQLSRTIDSSINTLRDSMERALKTDSREAVIRGSILPSASKIIKGGILFGATALINPVVAVIGLIGVFACKKSLKARERQLILDEIDVELKLCEKQIRMAEDNQDMKALKDLYKIQRTLTRQKQNITYKMKVYYNQNVPNTGGDNDD